MMKLKFDRFVSAGLRIDSEAGTWLICQNSMFTCISCQKQKPDNEAGSVGLLGNVGFLLVARAPWWPSVVCKDCSRQVRLFGIACMALVVAVIVVFVGGLR